MDDYGIGALALGGFRMLMRSLRQTGRTSRLVLSVQDGDVVVFLRKQDADDFLRRMRKQRPDVGVRTLIVDLADPNDLFLALRPAGPRGRVHLDHSWVEAAYIRQMEGLRAHLSKIQADYSPPGRIEPSDELQAERRRAVARFEGL